MKKNRLAAIILAALCCAFSLAGCGGKPNNGGAGKVPPVDEPPIDQPPVDEPPTDEKKPIDRTDIYINDDDDAPAAPPFELDDSRQYDYSSVVYTNRVGRFSQADGSYTAIIPNFDLALCYDVPFAYGTISCTVRSNNLVDTGIVFGVSEMTSNTYDDAEMSYYYYFLGMGGYAYLGKWDGPKNTWSALESISVGAVDANRDYELKVIYKGNYIVCYMNGEIMIGYKDKEFLTGTGFGIRVTAHPDVNANSSAAGVVISDVAVSSSYNY